jgi:AcrR family transcriptional regulator
MARRSDHSREELCEMALQAAESIVARQGSQALSTRKIAAEIGYTPGSLYLVFANLDDLVLRVNLRTLALLGDTLDRIVLRGMGPAEMLVELGRAYLRFAAANEGLWTLLFERRQSAATGAQSEAYQAQVNSLFARVERQLARLRPTRSAEEARLAARALWSGIHGICTLALDGKLDVPGVVDAERLAENLIAHYLRGWS